MGSQCNSNKLIRRSLSVHKDTWEKKLEIINLECILKKHQWRIYRIPSIVMHMCVCVNLKFKKVTEIARWADILREGTCPSAAQLSGSSQQLSYFGLCAICILFQIHLLSLFLVKGERRWEVPAKEEVGSPCFYFFMRRTLVILWSWTSSAYCCSCNGKVKPSHGEDLPGIWCSLATKSQPWTVQAVSSGEKPEIQVFLKPTNWLEELHF